MIVRLSRLVNDVKLIYCGLVVRSAVKYHGLNWFRWWLATYQAQSHHLKQSCLICDNWTINNKFQWNFIQHTDIYFQGNKISSAKWWPCYPSWKVVTYFPGGVNVSWSSVRDIAFTRQSPRYTSPGYTPSGEKAWYYPGSCSNAPK